MLAGIPLVLVTGLLAAINDALAVFVLLPVLCFIAGFVRLLYGTFIEGRTSRLKGDAAPIHAAVGPTQLGDAARSPELYPSRFAPIEGLTEQRAKTAEMLQPSSVTENTTRLLGDDAGTQGV